VNMKEPVCCFCFEPVAWYQVAELAVNATPGGDEVQVLYCHRRCLVEHVDARVPLHPDLDVDP